MHPSRPNWLRDDAFGLARVRVARRYVALWRPTVTVALVTVAIASDWLVRGTGIHPSHLSLLVGLGFTLCVAALARRGADPRLLTLIVTLLDVPMLAVWAWYGLEPGEQLAALTAPILIAAWLLGPRATAVLGISSIAAVLIVWFGQGAWSQSSPLPEVAWILVAVTALGVAIGRSVLETLREANDSLQETADQANQLATMRRRMVDDVSHELRTPLTTINGFLDTILHSRDAISEDEIRRLIVQARRGGERLQWLVDDLVDMERADSGKLPLRLECEHMGDVLRPAVAMVPIPDDRSVELDFADVDADAAMVFVDRARLEQIIGNLLSNAIDHGNGAVAVHCALHGSHVWIDVSDEGPGLPPGRERDAFEPFVTFGQQLGAPGLGLALARAAVEAHGGSLEYVETGPSDRHCFRVQLPRASSDVRISSSH